MNEQKGFFGHPPGLAYLAFTEAWERFSFSGMQALLVLYMVHELMLPGNIENVVGFSALRAALEFVYGPLATQPLSSAVFGLYTGLVFFTPVLGGLLGDRVFGQHMMVMVGAVFMAAGHFLMAFQAPFLLALLLLILGAGCLKGNISKQVGSLYADEDPLRTDAFQIFSMAINSGVILAPLICGTLGEAYGWHYGFGAAGIGMMIGLAIYISGRKYLPPDRIEEAREKAAILPKSPRMILMLAITFLLSTCFLTAAGQLGNVYSLWLQDHVDRMVGGRAIPVTWFQSFTPLFSVVITPLVLTMWKRRESDAGEAGLFSKMALGLVLAGGGLLMLALFASWDGRVNWLLLLPTHLMVCIAYIFVYPVSLALYSRVAPEGARAVYIGIFFLTSFVASNLVGWLGGFYSTLSAPSFWALHGSIALAGAALASVAALVGAGVQNPGVYHD